MPDSDTGFSPLPDVGQVTYNGVTFSALYRSEVSGRVVEDDARRTTKLLEYQIYIEGIVLLKSTDAAAAETTAAWLNLRNALTVHGAPLVYAGQGFGDLRINTGGTALTDVAWGPVPELLYFQTLGGARASFIKWRVTVRIAQLKGYPNYGPMAGGGGNLLTAGALPAAGGGGGRAAAYPPVLQWSYGFAISYDDEGYSQVSIRGVMEVPMTRLSVTNRQIPQDTINAYRQSWLDIRFDLTQYRVTKRNFDVSPDKRTCTWEYTAEELPPMGLPENCMKARGTMSVRPVRQGKGWANAFIQWTATLRCTYVVPKNKPRRWAFWAFSSLLWYRMRVAFVGGLPLLQNVALAAADAAAAFKRGVGIDAAFQALGAANAGLAARAPGPGSGQSILVDWGTDEGLYEDSRSISFEASWRVFCDLPSILGATGVWRWPAKDPSGQVPYGTGGRYWALSVRDISGWTSWLKNAFENDADAIVDLGGGTPVTRAAF